jgi:hypothetical protein
VDGADPATAENWGTLAVAQVELRRPTVWLNEARRLSLDVAPHCPARPKEGRHERTLVTRALKDLASMEANAQEAETLGTELGGGDQKIQQGFKERLEIREVLADRLGREIVLEPRP